MERGTNAVPGPDMVRLTAGGTPMSPEEQAIEEENDLRFMGHIDMDRYVKRGGTQSDESYPYEVPMSMNSIDEVAAVMNSMRQDIANLRREAQSIEGLRNDVRGMVDTIVQRSSVLRYPAVVVAKAVLYRALAWCVVAAGKGRQLARKIIAATSGVVYEFTKEPPPIYFPPTRDTAFDLGPLTGKAGETLRIVLEPESPFQIQKIMAVDDGKGYDTMIQAVFVGGKPQTPITSKGTLSLFFANNTLGNGLKTNWCKIGQKIFISVHFMKDSTFHGVLFGRAITNEKDYGLNLDEVLP